MKVTLLGCGGSGGVPLASSLPGGDWGSCDPGNPRNRRRRPSILVEQGGVCILVDATPDLRLQLLDAGVARIDAILFTHAHADHCHGLDDLRWLAYARQAPIPAYMDSTTQETLLARFAYAFTSGALNDSLYRPLLEDRLIDGAFVVDDVQVVPFVQDHGPQHSLGFRFHDFAYSTDVAELDDTAFDVLAGTRVWIVDCLREKPHPTHAHLERTLAWIERVRPERAVLTHMNHQFDYDVARRLCPPGVEPGFDGMVLELS